MPYKRNHKMAYMHFQLFVCLVLISLWSSSTQTRLLQVSGGGPDLEVEPLECIPETKGRNVVKSVTAKIRKIFAKFSGSDDKSFMFRVAIKESNNGEHPNTYREGYNGGIWQVDKTGFEATQDTKSHPGLKAKIQAIEKKTGIIWHDVTWEELRKPLYSGIAARLYVFNIEKEIPETPQEQGQYWKKYYNTAKGAGSASNFPTDVDVEESDHSGYSGWMYY